MGRLFWKFFLFIWLAQMAAVLGTGALFWVERQQFEAHLSASSEFPLPPELRDQPPPDAGQGKPDHHPPGGKPPRGRAFPVLPMIVGLLASLFCAAGLAWYIAKPIRQLRSAFHVATEGNLDVRIGAGMNGRRDELADLGEDFDHMTERLQSLMAGQRRLMHDVSHELRSPLARLQAAIGLARQQPARTEDSLQRIEREGERIDVLVGELLTLSRLEAGVAAPLEAVDMDELLLNIVEDARFEGAARLVSIEFEPGPSAVVQANPELLHRAIENVVRNALRFSPDGGVIQIHSARTGENSFLLKIIDQGPGIPASDLEAIFVPFYRGSAQISGTGFGLGLAIARQVIVAVNGKIEAKINSRHGLLVEISLPA